VDIATQPGVRDREQIWAATNGWLQRPIPSLLSAAIAMVYVIVVGSTSARGQALAKDPWQTYMEAALASDQGDDFKIEAITLNGALAFAKAHDPRGQRPALARLPLMLAYGELDRKELMRPLAAQGLRIDVSNLDKRYDDYVGTIENYASSYYDRWNAHTDDNPSDDFKQGIRFYGMKSSYLIEVALRAKLRPGDKIGLASTMSQVGLVYKRGGDLECAGYDYRRASEMFSGFQQMRGALAWAGNRFSVGNPTTATAQQSATGQAVLDTQVYLVLALGLDMVYSADKTLHSHSSQPSMAKTDLAQCDGSGPPAKTPPPIGFDAQVSRASDYYHAVFELARELHEHWPTHPFFGLLDFRFADLYGLEFEMSKMHPGKYPDSLAKARSAYEDSLAIFTHAEGPNSRFLHTVAVSYVDLLIEAKLNDEAKKIEDRYGVAPSTASN